MSRELLTRIDELTNPSFGCYPNTRTMSIHLKYGLINLDKPSGPSSHEVVSWVKKILGVEHAGHGGTLDPKVTGVLPVGLGDATKVIRAFLLSGKEYICVMRLHGDIAEAKVRNVMNEFVGEILQRPPLRSSVLRQIRVRRIYYLSDYEFKDRHVLFRVGCQAGTYIRKLVYDVGEALGSGAHMEELRRTRAGPFTEGENLVSLYELKEGYDLFAKGDESILRKIVMPVEKAVGLLPKIYVRDSAVSSLCHGAKLAIPGIAKLEAGIKSRNIVAIMSLKSELVGLGKAEMSSEEMMKADHGIASSMERVVMSLETYPKMWHSQGKDSSRILEPS